LAGLLLAALTVTACAPVGGTGPDAGTSAEPAGQPWPTDVVRSGQSGAPPRVPAPAGPLGQSGGRQQPAAAPTFPPVVLPEGLGTACPGRRPSGWVAAENRRPGSTLALPPDTGAVQGYTDPGSASCGQVVDVHLGTTPRAAARQVVLSAYRIGSYHGAGSRLVWRSAPVTVSPGALPSGAAAPHLVVPSWPVVVRLTLDGGWPPGFYLLVPRDARDRAAGPAVPLVVRDDGGGEPMLVKASTLTWNAYNTWGGWSLYQGRGRTAAARVADRARGVAVHRPLIGSGYRQLRFMDLPVVRAAEQLAVARGPDVGYVTDLDVDADPTRLLGHAEVISGGHSEYWTTRMYDGLLAALAAGVNAVFLGANNLWWHTRLDGAGAGGEPDRQWVFRNLAEDPAARVDPSAATVLWQSAPLRRDPAAVLGQSHAAIGVRGGLQLLDPPAWFTAGTGLAARGVLAGAVGNEADGFNAAAANPAAVQVLAAGVLRGGQGSVLVTSSYSVLPSGAAVFAAGTTDWACAPTGRCDDRTFPAATARAVARLTANVLATLAVPRAGAAHPIQTGRLAGGVPVGTAPVGTAPAGTAPGGTAPVGSSPAAPVGTAAPVAVPPVTVARMAAVLARGAFGRYGSDEDEEGE
jgi:hypothetical protein